MSAEATSTGLTLRERIAKALLAKALARRIPNATPEQIDKALAAYAVEHKAAGAGDHPFLDWLSAGGFEEILKFIMAILPLFAAEKPS